MVIVAFKGNENIALLRPAYQSSTLYRNVASRGVDGSDARNSKAATGRNDYNPWWKVKLSYPTWINQVEIVMEIGEQLVYISWWRHQMEAFSVLLAICAGDSPVPGEFPTQRPVTRGFDVLFHLCLNKPSTREIGRC